MADDSAISGPWPDKVESGVTYSLTAPGAFATLLAGCGVQQATHLRGNTCTVLWARLLGPAVEHCEATASGADEQAKEDSSRARAVSHGCVPTRVLEMAVAPFLPVSVAIIGMCPIPGSSDGTCAQLFVPPFDGSSLLLPRIVVLPAEARHAASAATITDAEGSPSINVSGHDPWRRFATTARLHSTAAVGTSLTTVHVAADAVADTLSEIGAVAPFVTTLDVGGTVREVEGDLRLPDAAVAGLSFVKAIEGDAVAISFLRALMFQLNNERGPGAVTADGSIAPAARKASGTQIERLRVFSVTGTVEDGWVHDDYSNITSIAGFFGGRELLYFIRSCRHSLRSFATGFGGNVGELLAAAREESLLSSTLTAEGAAVESFGTLLPAITSVSVIENGLEKGFFASLTDRIILDFGIDDCGADADDFLDFCRHSAKPLERCTSLDFRTSSFAPEVVAAALPFMPSLQRFTCGHGVNHDALVAIAERCPDIDNFSIVGLAEESEGRSSEETAAVLLAIITRPSVRSVNLVGCPLTAADITAVRAAKSHGKMTQLRVMDAEVCDEQKHQIDQDRDAIEGLVPEITYDRTKRTPQLPAQLRAHLAAIEPPLSPLEAETSLCGDLNFVAAHRLQTQSLPPPLVIPSCSSRAALVGPEARRGQSVTGEHSASKLSSIAPVIWGNVDVVACLPLGVHIGSGRMPLLREVALGGPAAMLFAVADHCPLLEKLSWALPRDSENPLIQWCFGSTPGAFSLLEDLPSAASFVEATTLTHRPACCQTLATLTLVFHEPDRPQHSWTPQAVPTASDSDEEDEYEENEETVTNPDEDASGADLASSVESPDGSSVETESNGDDDDHGETDGGPHPPGDAHDAEHMDSVANQTFAVSCAVFVKECPALTCVTLRNAPSSDRQLYYRMIPELVNATVAEGRRACDFAEW